MVSKSVSFGKKGIDLFKKLKYDSCEFIMPSNSNIFFMPNTKSMFYVLLMLILNLCPCISITIGMMNNTLTTCPFPTWILFILEANFGNECRDLIINNVIWTCMICLLLYPIISGILFHPVASLQYINFWYRTFFLSFNLTLVVSILPKNVVLKSKVSSNLLVLNTSEWIPSYMSKYSPVTFLECHHNLILPSVCFLMTFLVCSYYI